MWGGVGGGLIAYGFHYHLHCLHPGRLGVGLGGWGVDSIRLPLSFALSTPWKTASVHTLHMPKPNVTRVQSATEWTASVHTCQKTQTSKWNWQKFADQVRCRPCQKKRPPIAHVETP